MTTTATSTIRKTIGRDLADGSYIEINVELRGDDGQLSPGFSVTGDVWERRSNSSARKRAARGLDIDAGGQVVELIAEAAPELAPLLAVHLADPDGVPMHAKANGWYFYSGAAADYERRMIAKGQDYGYSRLLETSDHDRAARALHIPPADLPAGLDQEGFEEFCDQLAETTWATQAATAADILAALVDGDGVEDRR